MLDVALFFMASTAMLLNLFICNIYFSLMLQRFCCNSVFFWYTGVRNFLLQNSQVLLQIITVIFLCKLAQCSCVATKK
jgi:hypothetical protein